MDDNQFGEDAKEKLEREIEELKRQKEIKDLQKQKEELEKTVFGGLGGQPEEQKQESKQVEEEIDDEEIVEEKYISNRMTTILAALVAVAIVVVGSGIFYLRSQNKKKRENLKKEMTKVSKNENISAVTESQSNSTSQTTEQNPTESTNTELPKVETKADTNGEVQKSGGKLVVQSPVTVKKGSYCVNPNPAESAFGTDTVEDSYAEHGYMADLSFEDCVINSGGSAKHTGPVTITVSLAEEKNYDAVMNRNKWYLENGQISRISGRDSAFLYFNGWLMYKQSN